MSIQLTTSKTDRTKDREYNPICTEINETEGTINKKQKSKWTKWDNNNAHKVKSDVFATSNLSDTNTDILKQWVTTKHIIRELDSWISPQNRIRTKKSMNHTQRRCRYTIYQIEFGASFTLHIALTSYIGVPSLNSPISQWINSRMILQSINISDPQYTNRTIKSHLHRHQIHRRQPSKHNHVAWTAARILEI